ncbi:MAG: PorP/SprF family type IX secretion system membrane protein [Bacteroidia bacterium]|nr:PorP/SprF family type IX secretion system membrane protein [Bacteroidia bacterium]
MKLNNIYPQTVTNRILIRFAMFCLLFLHALTGVNAQDIHFSQFQSSPLNLNPALTGFYNGDYRFIANHRRQWKSVTVPYRTFSGSFDMPVNFFPESKQRYSLGLLINNDRAGDSELGLTQVGISAGAIRALGRDSIHFLSGGIQFSYVRRSINYSDLTFDEQFTGDGFDPNTGNSENFSGDNQGYFDFGAGLTYLIRVNDRFKAGAGISLQHINRPNDSFFDEGAKMFPRLQTDLKADFAIATRFDLIPALIFMNQGSFREITGGTSVRFRLSELPGRNYALYLGSWLRAKDAFIASAGFDYNNLNVGVSYDFNTSDLDRASNGKGGYELSLIYIIRKVKPLSIKPPCPLY